MQFVNRSTFPMPCLDSRFFLTLRDRFGFPVDYTNCARNPAAEPRRSLVQTKIEVHQVGPNTAWRDNMSRPWHSAKTVCTCRAWLATGRERNILYLLVR